MQRGSGRRGQPSRRPTMTPKRVKQIAKTTEHKMMESAKFSKTKSVSNMSVVNREPKQTMVVRINGLQAAGWNGSVQPPAAQIYANIVISNFKDYVPKYFQIHSVTVTTPRSITGGSVRNVTGDAVLGLMTQMSVQFIGNWLGLPVSVLPSTNFGTFFDVVKEFILDLSTGNRTKATYYPSARDEGLVIDVKNIEKPPGQAQMIPLICNISFPVDTPQAQCDDVVIDVNITRWGFLRELTEREKMNDPWYRGRMRVNQQRQEYIIAVDQLTRSSLQEDDAEPDKLESKPLILENLLKPIKDNRLSIYLWM